jgi:hypothetical protein
MDKGKDLDSPNASATPGDAAAGSAGSPSITLLVVDGPHDGLAFSGSVSAATLGREVGNSIELPLDPQVSRDHCALQYSSKDRCWILDDRGSANGTWYDGRRLTAPQKLKPDTEFVVGTTAILFSESTVENSFLPEPARIEESARGLVERLDGTASRGFGAAHMLALSERSPVLTDRHLFLGLVSVNGEISFVSHGKGLINTRFIRDRVQANEYWLEPKAWIAQLVCIGDEEDSLFADQLAITPRVFRALTVAEMQAEGFGAESITSNNLLFGLFDDDTSRIREWFLAEGGDLRKLLAQLTRPPTRVAGHSRGSSVTRKITTDSAVLPRPMPKPTVFDPVVTDLAAATLHTASKYRLAAAEDRRKALRETVTNVIAEISADRRKESLEQLRQCFPLTQGARFAAAPAAASDEVAQLQQRIDELEAALDDVKNAAAAPAVPISWSDVLGSDAEIRTDRHRIEDAAALDVVHQLVQFSLAVESFIIRIVAGLTQTSMTGIMSMPGFNTTIRRAINFSVSGQPMAEDFRPYLTALETWLVATIAAYHRAPEDWFTAFWNKTSPSRIESKVPAKILSDAKCWGYYKNIVRRISPDLVADEIMALVREIAQSQYDELNNGRT